MSKEIITSAEVAELLSCTEEQAEELTRKGEIPGTKFGRSWLYVRSDLLAYIAERARKEAQERRENKLLGRAGMQAASPIKQKRRTPPVLPVLPTASQPYRAL